MAERGNIFSLIFLLFAGEPVRFIGSTPKDWYNPMNWNFLENSVVADWNDATLFMDRIPCKHDTVAFPEVRSVGCSANKEDFFQMQDTINFCFLSLSSLFVALIYFCF